MPSSSFAAGEAAMNRIDRGSFSIESAVSFALFLFISGFGVCDSNVAVVLPFLKTDFESPFQKVNSKNGTNTFFPCRLCVRPMLLAPLH